VAAAPAAADCDVLHGMRPGPRTFAALLAAALSALAGCGGSSGDEEARTPATATTTTAAPLRLGPAFGSMKRLPGLLTTAPPWPANADMLQQRLRAIGLEALTEEGQALHIHQHLDIFVEGRRVGVPSDVGVGPGLRFIAAVHTHEGGVIHVESPTVTDFSLGQFFALWGVRLDRRCIGRFCAGDGRRLRAWVNGRPVTADPTRIVLAEHQQIVLAFGTPAQDPDPVPATFDFAALGL
jgi:hypothetical protein